jgi:hypothetical protein
MTGLSMQPSAGHLVDIHQTLPFSGQLIVFSLFSTQMIFNGGGPCRTINLRLPNYFSRA